MAIDQGQHEGDDGEPDHDGREDHGLGQSVGHRFGDGRLSLGVPIKLSETPGAIRHVGPELGEHNDYVFSELLGLSDRTREDYRARGII